MVSVLDLKVVRDLRAMWPQVTSIALLIAAGTAVLVMSVSNYLALVLAMETHYRNERFGDLFAQVKRAPLALADRVREIDGVGVVEARISAPVRVIREDEDVPLSGRMISLPPSGQPMLNRLHLVEGTWIEPDRFDEIIINAAFGQARGVRPGHTIEVVLEGRLRRLRVVGLALSPEFVFATRSALPLPDDRNYVVMWAHQDVMASAFDMTGAFNDLVISLAPGTGSPRVIEEIDRLLVAYGGVGAFGRRDLPSHRFLEDELAEQETLGIAMPGVFFAIAAFLLHVVLGRLVEAQREQIASLRALGFPKRPIMLHYFKLVSVIALAGGLVGLVLGRWLASVIIESYRTFFRFPVLEPQLDPRFAALAVLAGLVAANMAAASAIWRTSRLSPAEAMRPRPPYSGKLAVLLGASRSWPISTPDVMALRTLIGHPFRTLLTIVGIALSVPLVLFGLFWFDAIDFMLDTSFQRIERGDAVVTFTTPVPIRALHELRATPGVLLAEGQRVVAVRLVAGHRTYRTSLTGLEWDSELKVLRDRELMPLAPPIEGLMLTRQLAGHLGVGVGDAIVVEVLESRRSTKILVVEKLSDEVLGFSATMERQALNRLLGEDASINVAALKLDPVHASDTWHRIARMPKVQASSAKSLWLSLFNDTIAGMIVIGAVTLAGFGVLITFGIVYNSARVALQERAWELASLRILGFTRTEVAKLLSSELAFEVMVAIPIGLVFGRWLIGFIISLRARETFQIPPVIEPQSYVIAALIVAVAASVSAYAVRRRIDTLDLVATLKTRD
jgi:putative ABC transport system permease protein